MKIESIAKICHDANKSLCEVNGDNSQYVWEEAEEWQRKSAINSVKFTLENPDAGPDAQHNDWMAEKVNDGWKYGEIKNAEIKEHPCIVPFDELPEFQKAKDHLFRGIVKGLAAFVTEGD